MPVKIDGQDNPLSVFEVRTSSYHSLKALRSQLEYVAHRFGGLLHVPLKLQIWHSSNEQSGYELFDLFKLSLDASSELEAMKLRKAKLEEESEMGLAHSPDSTFMSLNQNVNELDRAIEFEAVHDFHQPTGFADRSVSRAISGQRTAAGGALPQASASHAISDAVKAAALHSSVLSEA